MYPKEIAIFVGKHSGNILIPNDTLYYRFFVNKNGVMEKIQIEKKKIPTIEVYEKILADFFINKQLISVGYGTFQKNVKEEEYLGIKLQNNEEEKLNVYFSSKALDGFRKLEQLVQIIKLNDFYEYAKKAIDKNRIERFTLRSAKEERSSILYIRNNLQNNYFRHIEKELGYYYRKNNGQIDKNDLWTIFTIIRYFINKNLRNNPYYIYNSNPQKKKDILVIRGNENSFIEIEDQDLIREIEKARIIDDLWLLMHNVIDKMPLQEESISEKEVLKRKRMKYLEENPFSQS